MQSFWAVLAILAAVVAGTPGCDTPCGYRILTRLDSGTLTVGCCGAAAVTDVMIPDEPNLAVDLAQAALPDRVGGQDLWLTTTDCAQLFDQPYPQPGTGPRPAPRCRTLLGPVPAGAVSPRVELLPGRYRVVMQAYAANTAANGVRFDVGVWGTACGGTPAGL